MPVIVVGTVMLTFISFWKTAAVVLCDLASTSYYIGGIVEQAIGPGAPWFILALMLFSYAVCNVYVESCSMFVRGGVYRVVREAMGHFMGKLAVSALLFDYILTGPISSVSAGQYLTSLLLEITRSGDSAWAAEFKRYGSMAFAIGVTFYFYNQNLKGIHESSDKAFKIMIATAVMAVVILGFGAVTLVMEPSTRDLPPLKVDLTVKLNHATGHDLDPLGFLGYLLPAGVLDVLRSPELQLFSLFGLLAALVAFGHSILALSGEETLAQVYREVEAPKLPNFRKAAFIVFAFSTILTTSISFLAVMIVPDERRMSVYHDNLIGGLAMNVYASPMVRLLLNIFVVVIGSLILSGALNTAIIGSNGVLNRVAEDGVVPDWLRKPHPTYGTTYRILRLILGLKLFTILASGGNVLLLGEAYAFGVVWSFVFMTLSMVILRFRRPDMHREFRFPFNYKVGGVEVPFGLLAVFAVLASAALINLFTKEIATVAGLAFTGLFLTVFTVTERVNRKHQPAEGHTYVEKFDAQHAETATALSLGLSKRYTKLVAIRSPFNLFMLEKALAETDPDSTNVVVMTAKMLPHGEEVPASDIDRYDQQLMTAVVERAEKAGKRVQPLIVPTNNALHAVLKLAQELKAQEVILGLSNKYTADEQMEQIALYWMTLHAGSPPPVTVRLLSRDRDILHDIAGGNRIPKVSEAKAKNLSELRASGVGIDRVLLVHDGAQTGSDLFDGALTMLDADVLLSVAHAPAADHSSMLIREDLAKARKFGREIVLHELPREELGPKLVALAKELKSDMILLPHPAERDAGLVIRLDDATDYVLRNSPCVVSLAVAPGVPAESAAE